MKASCWIVFASAAVAAILLVVAFSLMSTLRLQTGVSCFFYDKPPRTGSTTVANAVRACLDRKGYTAIHNPIAEIERNEVVRDLLTKEGGWKSAVMKHVEVSDSDIKLLRTHCDNLFYLTSSRPMKERITSRWKYSMTRKHGNSTLSDKDFEVAKTRAHTDDITETELEKYPFTGNMTMEPDFVIRSENLDGDLTELLTSMGCRNDYRQLNIHELQNGSAADADFANSIELEFGDARYKELSQLASRRNKESLKLAAKF